MSDNSLSMAAFAVVISQVAFAAALWMPLHKLSFYSLGLVKVFGVNVYVTQIKFPEDSNDLCKILVKVSGSSSLGWCFNLTGEHSLSEASSLACTPIAERLWPAFCSGLWNANGIGKALVAVVLLNFLLNCCALGLVVSDLTKRTMAIGMVGGGFLLTVGVIIAYYAMVIAELDSTTAGGSPLGLLLSSVPMGLGIGEGLLVACVGALIELLVLGLMFGIKEKKIYDDDSYGDEAGSGLDYVTAGEYGSVEAAPPGASAQAPAAQQQSLQQPYLQQQPSEQQAFGQQTFGQEPFPQQSFGQQPAGQQPFGQQQFGQQQLYGQQPAF